MHATLVGVSESCIFPNIALQDGISEKKRDASYPERRCQPSGQVGGQFLREGSLDMSGPNLSCRHKIVFHLLFIERNAGFSISRFW